MAIEVTDEMVRAFMCAYAKADDGSSKVILEDAAEKAGLAAVLAIAERDRVALIERQWAQLEPCPSLDPEGTWKCEREAGHEGTHRALRWHREWTEPQP